MTKRVKKKIRNQNAKFLIKAMTKLLDGDLKNCIFYDNKVIILDKSQMDLYRKDLDPQPYNDCPKTVLVTTPPLEIRIDATEWCVMTMEDSVLANAKLKRLSAHRN